MDESKLTPWFSGATHKPKRRGVYMLMCGGKADKVGYQLWDGHKWGPWHETVSAAANTAPGDYATDATQSDDWRGLRKRPNDRSQPAPPAARKDADATR